jgi:hypothetical protein
LLRTDSVSVKSLDPNSRLTSTARLNYQQKVATPLNGGLDSPLSGQLGKLMVFTEAGVAYTENGCIFGSEPNESMANESADSGCIDAADSSGLCCRASARKR